jgi:hypothetical protein
MYRALHPLQDHQMKPPSWLLQQLDIRLLTDPVAAMSDPLPAAIGTGDHFAMIMPLKAPGSVDEARSSAPSTGLADHQRPPRRGNSSDSLWAGKQGNAEFSSRPSHYIRRGADRKGSLLVPTARLEVHDLADGPTIADSLRNSSLHNTPGTLNLWHRYFSHLTNATFGWFVPTLPA